MGPYLATSPAARAFLPHPRPWQCPSRPPRTLAALATGLLLPLLTGCLAPQSRLDALQTQNRALSEQSRAQLAEIENLRIHSRNVEDQLQRTEEELALLEERVGLDGRGLADLRREHDTLRRQLRGGPGAMLPELGQRLAELARQHPELEFDPQTGIAKLDTDILFDSGKADLKPGAKEMLAGLARTLKSAEAQDLRLMVVGHTDDRQMARRPARDRYPSNFHLSTARALAVAEQLRELGIEPGRIGVAGFASHQPVAPNTTAEDRRANRRVELFVLAPEVPIVGWTETIPSVY